MADDVTTGELGRRLFDLRSSIDNLAARVVTRDVWQIEQQRITEWLVRLEREHTELEAMIRTDKKAADEERVTNRRLIYSAILTGAIAIVVTFIGRLYGAS